MLASARDRRKVASRVPIAPVDPADDVALQRRLVAALIAATNATLIETHISFVLLTGTLAYKIKKAVNLGFLDFRSLAARRFYCQEELRLNRRLAPETYLDVVAITGTVDAPKLAGEGPVIEYAVKMREFPQDALAGLALARGELTPRQIDALATRIAAFHRAGNAMPASGELGAPHTILSLALENFAQLRPLLHDPADLTDLDALAAWTSEHHAECAQAMARRRREGFVRECHGDLHLGNIAIVAGEPLVFDCIEFNDEMRWIDVMNEIAFTTMDLQDRGRADLAHRFLNAYLETTGDYAGLGVLRFYLVYRAMVRAKVVRLRANQLSPGAPAAALSDEYRGYLRLAQEYARPSRPAIVITHGFSGSGKTTLSQRLLECVGAVRIRTDVERKRLQGLDPARGAATSVGSGLYAPEATLDTYLRALSLTRKAAAAGYAVIVDGAFLKRWQRDWFRALAEELGLPFLIVSCAANEATLRARIARRLREAADASDADLAVLGHQLRTHEPLALKELAKAVVYDVELAGYGSTPRGWQTLLDRLATVQ